ncbi:MAG: NAD-dependent epimerase/dehydratase family protein [Nitrospinales bacterium]
MRILVTGASGFIGKNILTKWSLPVSKITAIYHETDLTDFCRERTLKHVAPVPCDLGSPEDIGKLVEVHGGFYDLIIYLAANGDPAKSASDPALDLEMNTKYLINLLEQITCGKFIFFSSGAVYDKLKGPVTPGSALNPVLPYAVSKLASERYIEFFSRHRKTINTYYLIRFFGAYGEFEPERKIFRRLLETFQNRSSADYPIKGNGLNLIDAMHAEDTVRALEKIAESNKDSMTLDLASHDPLTVNQLVEKAASLCGCKVELKHEGQAPEYIEFRTVDDTMKKEFGFVPEISLETGLKWYIDQLERRKNCNGKKHGSSWEPVRQV